MHFCLFAHPQLGQLDILIHEHNLKMESKVLLLQETLEKTEANLQVKNQEVHCLSTQKMDMLETTL